MRCSKIERLLTPLLDGRLGDDERAEVEAHLAGCERCRQTHALLANAGVALRGVGPAEPAEELAARAARAAFAAEDQPNRDWVAGLLQQLRWPAAATAAAAAVLAVGLTMSLPTQLPSGGVGPDAVTAALVGDDELVSDGEMLSEVLGQEEE